MKGFNYNRGRDNTADNVIHRDQIKIARLTCRASPLLFASDTHCGKRKRDTRSELWRAACRTPRVEAPRPCRRNLRRFLLSIARCARSRLERLRNFDRPDRPLAVLVRHHACPPRTLFHHCTTVNKFPAASRRRRRLSRRKIQTRTIVAITDCGRGR